MVTKAVQVKNIGRSVIQLGAGQGFRPPVAHLLMLGDVDLKQFGQQRLQPVPVGVGADQLAGDLRAVDRCRQCPEGIVHRGDVEAAEMKQLEDAGIAQHPFKVGRGGLTAGDLYHMRVAVAGGHLNKTQTIPAGAQTHGFAVYGDDRAKVQVIGQVALVKMVRHGPPKTQTPDRQPLSMGLVSPGECPSCCDPSGASAAVTGCSLWDISGDGSRILPWCPFRSRFQGHSRVLVFTAALAHPATNEGTSAILNTPPNPAHDPILACLDAPDDSVLALIAGVEGPSYRPLGAAMAVLGAERRVGTLSSGCIESDISRHALDARAAGTPKLLRYGRGSPFRDIELPCGGGLDILLLPKPDPDVLQALAGNRAARMPCTLEVDIESGAMRLRDSGPTGRSEGLLRVRCAPDIRFLVFGKGPEASTFAGLVQSAGYPNLLLSPDGETLAEGTAAGCPTRILVMQVFPREVAVDDRTAIVLFFHDHEWEPPILQGALETPAFYIGAQGSQRARDARLLTLEAMGVSKHDRARLRGPVGLIPSARDPGTLAVSVLAEVLAVAMQAASSDSVNAQA